MTEKIKALKAAFPHTLPVLAGFIFFGIAYGILMSTKGYGVGWTTLMSMIVFAGSMQYVAITLLTSAFNPIYALLLTLMVNARHLFYGIAMLEKLKGTGKFKPYLIFTMCDETFSILCSTNPPKGINRNWFFFFIALLNYIYWVTGSVLGSALGLLVNFNTKGLDFVLTALFVVIFIGQWENQKNHTSSVMGISCSIICLIIFGKNNFIIPSMICILVTLTLLRKKLEKEMEG